MESIEDQKTYTEVTENSISEHYSHSQIPEDKKACVTLTITIDKFSDDINYANGIETDFEKTSDGWLHPSFIPLVYCNGIDSSNKGEVCVLFSKSDISSSIFIFSDVLFTLSVVDAEKNKQRTQTLCFNTLAPKTDFGFDKYISRKELLESSDLLPDDTLTLHVEICWKLLTLYDDTKLTLDYYHYESYFEYCLESAKFFLKLDSDLGKRLSEESKYFEKMSEIRMCEEIIQKWKVYWTEFPFFLDISHVMMGGGSLIISNIDYLCSLYIIADKYDIPLVKGICRDLFEKYMCDGNVDKIHYLAQKHNDGILKKIIQRFQGDSEYRSKQNETNSAFSVQSQLQIQLKSPKKITNVAEKLTAAAE